MWLPGGRRGTSWWGSHEAGPQQLVKEESVGVGLEDTGRSGCEPWSQAVGGNEASTVLGLEKAKAWGWEAGGHWPFSTGI